jgi:hypothetical protein
MRQCLEEMLPHEIMQSLPKRPSLPRDGIRGRSSMAICLRRRSARSPASSFSATMKQTTTACYGRGFTEKARPRLA